MTGRGIFCNLDREISVPAKDLEPVAKLLEQVAYEEQKEQPLHVESVVEPVVEVEKCHEKVTNVEIDSHQVQQLETEHDVALGNEAEYFDGEFQALFFEVAGLTLAVPLKALGGIHELGEVNHLFGKPKWFKGVMINRTNDVWFDRFKAFDERRHIDNQIFLDWEVCKWLNR